MTRVTVELEREDLDVIAGALSAQLRYARNGLDRAKEDDAINRWASFCVRLGAVMQKIGAAR